MMAIFFSISFLHSACANDDVWNCRQALSTIVHTTVVYEELCVNKYFRLTITFGNLYWKWEQKNMTFTTVE